MRGIKLWQVYSNLHSSFHNGNAFVLRRAAEVVRANAITPAREAGQVQGKLIAVRKGFGQRLETPGWRDDPNFFVTRAVQSASHSMQLALLC